MFYNNRVYDFQKGQIVHILDRPFGHPIKSLGKIVGIVNEETYSVLLTSGLNTGLIKKFKYYELRGNENGK
jgi:hypothetical protein